MKWSVPVYLILVTSVLYLGFSNWAYDDPFITFRYAQNLSQGIGFVYNPGERVLSTTTPLFTLVLAAGGLIWSDYHHLAILIGAASLGIGALLIFALSRIWDVPLIGWMGVLVYPTFPLLVSTLGSEMPLYLALCLGAFVAYARKSYVWTGFFASFACLARADGILIPALLAGDYLIRNRENLPWKAILVFVFITLLWSGFAWFYFGSPIPVTLGVKQNQGRLAISEQFAPGFMTILQSYSTWPYYLFAGLMLAGFIYAFWTKRELAYFLSWPIVYFIAYTILGVSRYFWYYAPLVPGFIVAAGLGIDGIYKIIRSLSSKLHDNNSTIVKFLPAGLLLIFFLANLMSLREMYSIRDNRYTIYKAAGEWLDNNILPEEKVGALEVGIIGYFAGRPMVDFAGLIQPDVSESMEKNDTYEDGAIFAVNRYQPEYIVLHEGMFVKLEGEILEAGCEIITILSGEDFDYPTDLLVYDCRK
jgi:hypothetical protein